MTEDAIQQRFLQAIEIRARADRYIDRDEEREILEIALQLGMTRNQALSALAQVCRNKRYVMESLILKDVQDQLQMTVERKGRIERNAFEAIFQKARQAVEGKKSDRELKRLMVEIMEDTGHNRVKTGWFRDWYGALKREVGLG